jgi:hypothetical protein
MWDAARSQFIFGLLEESRYRRNPEVTCAAR